MQKPTTQERMWSPYKSVHSFWQGVISPLAVPVHFALQVVGGLINMVLSIPRAILAIALLDATKIKHNFIGVGLGLMLAVSSAIDIVLTPVRNLFQFVTRLVRTVLAVVLENKPENQDLNYGDTGMLSSYLPSILLGSM